MSIIVREVCADPSAAVTEATVVGETHGEATCAIAC
jgi:hypothetical protein